MDRYKDYGPYADVVNWGVYEAPFSLEDGRKMFAGKTIMSRSFREPSRRTGGRSGRGRKEETRKVIEDLEEPNFILGS